jgi:hypothetical protein
MLDQLSDRSPAPQGEHHLQLLWLFLTDEALDVRLLFVSERSVFSMPG